MEARVHEWMLRIALNSYIDDLTATLRADKRLPFALWLSTSFFLFRIHRALFTILWKLVCSLLGFTSNKSAKVNALNDFYSCDFYLCVSY